MQGFSTASAALHRGHIGELDVVQKAPSKFQIKAVRMLANKSGLAARVDAQRNSLDGRIGKQLRD